MEIELGLKITHTRDDATLSTEFRFAKDHSGPLFFSRETATMYILIAYLRGFKRENIKIKISEDGKQLTIGGKKSVQEITLQGWIMHKKDVEIREFKKVFFIPDGVNLNRTKAKFNNEESTLRITMPKSEKGICGIEIQEVTTEDRERHETAVPVDDQAHEKEPEIQIPEEIEQLEQRESRCEHEISEVVADQSFLKDREYLEEGGEARIERKETINDIVEKPVDTLQFEKDNQVEQGEVGGGESVTAATVDKSPQKDAASMEEVEAPMLRKIETIDHVADQTLDASQGDKQNQLEQDELRGDKQDQVEKAFDKVQSNKQDQNQRDVSGDQPEAPPVVTDETSHRGGKSLKEDAESVEENKMDQMAEQKHNEADQVRKRDVRRCELEIPQAMSDETTQKYAKSLEDAESMMPSKLDQLVDKQTHDKADTVQPSEVSRYEPEMPQVPIDETFEKDISEAQPDKMEKFQLWEREIPESLIDETQKNDAKPLEGGSENMVESKKEIDQIEEHLDGEQQSNKVDHEEKMEVNSSEPKLPEVMHDTTSQLENSQEDGTEMITESEEKTRDQVAEQVVDEQQYGKSSRKNGSSKEEVEAPIIKKKEKTDHVINQAFTEIQENKQNQMEQDEFQGDKEDQVDPSLDDFHIAQQDQMNQRDVSRGEPEAPPVVTDDTSQKGGKSLEEAVSRGEHDEAEQVQHREVSRRELEIPHAVIDETAQKDVKTLEEDAESIMPNKVDQLVDKPHHAEADQVKPSEISKYEPEIPQAMIDEAIEKHIGEAQHDKMDQLQHKEVGRHELEMPEAMIYETLQKDDKPLEEGVEPTIRRKEKIDRVEERTVGEQQSDKVGHAEQSEVSRYEPELPEPMVDVAFGKEEKSHEDGAELMRKNIEKIPNQVIEQVVDEQKHAKADQVEKREVSRLGPEMPAVTIDATSPEDGKSLQEAAEAMAKRKEKISQVLEQVFDEPKCDKMEQVKQRTVSRSKPHRPQSIIDDTSENGKSLEGADSVIKFPEQVVEEPQSATDKTNRVEQREVSRFKPERSDAVESSLKDGKSLEEDAELMMKNKEKIDQVLEKVVEHGKAEDVFEVCSEIKSRKFIPEEKSKESENKGEELQEKLNEAESKDIQAVAKVMPQTTASTRLKKATPEKKELTASFPKSTSREPLEAHYAAQEEVSNMEPEVAKDTVKEASKKDGEFLKETTKQNREKEERSESLMEHESNKWLLNEVDKVHEDAPELDGNKLILNKKSKKAKSEEKESGMEEKFNQDPEKMESAIEMVPQTTVSLHLGEDTPEKVEGTTASLKMPAPHFKPFKADHEVTKTADDVAPRKHEETFKGSKTAKIEKQDVHVKNELQLDEVERMAEMDATKLLSEQKYEMPKTKVKEETEKLGEEKHDQTNEKEDFTHVEYPETIVETDQKKISEWKPEVARTAADDEPKEDKELVEEATKSKICSKEEVSQDMRHVAIEHQLNERERVAKFSPEMDAKELIREGEVEKKKTRSKTETETEEKLDGGESMEVPQTTESMHLREAIPKKKEPEQTYSVGVKDVTKCEIETAGVAYGEVTRSDEQALKATSEPKFDGNEGTDQAIQDVIHEWQTREVEEIALDSPKKDGIGTPDEKYEKPEKLGINEPEKFVGEKLHEREFREMEGPAQVMPQSSGSMQLEENSYDGNKHPVSSASYPATPQIETSKPHHFEKKDISKWEPEVGKVLVDEHLETDKESLDDIIETKRKGEEGIDQDEQLGQLNKPESAGKTSAEMDGSGTITAEELENLKLEKKEETEKAVEMKINEGPKKIDMVLQTIESLQPEEDTPKRAELPSASTLHPKMTSDFDASESYYDGVKEATERELEVAKDVVEEARKKEEYQELAKPKIKTEVESDQAMQHVTDDLRVSDIDGAATVSPSVDHRTFLSEQSFGNPKLEIKEESNKMEEEVDEGDFKATGEATGMVPKIITGLKIEEFDPAMKEYPVISPLYQETPRLGNEISDTRQDRQAEITKWKPEFVQSAVDKMQQKVSLPSEQSADSQIKSESEKKETEMNFEGPIEPEPNQEKKWVEAPILADELPQDSDHAKGSETAPERQELGMSFEGHMKPAPGRERQQDETPFLADDRKSDGDHRKDEDSGLENENELDKKKPGLSTEEITKTFDQKKQHVETPSSDNQSQGDGDHALDEKHEQRSVTTPDKQEFGRSFEGPTESAEPDQNRQQIDTPLLGDEKPNDGDLREDEDYEQGDEIESEKKLSEVFFGRPMKPETDQRKEQNELSILDDEPELNVVSGRDEVHGLHSEIKSEITEPHVIPEGPMNPEIDSEKEQVETPLLADKQENDDGRRKAKVRELGKEIEEIHDHLQLPEKKEIEEHESPETELQKDFRIEQTSRKMDTVVPIKCKLRSFLFFAGSTFLLPLIVIVMKKSLIEFKSKKR